MWEGANFSSGKTWRPAGCKKTIQIKCWHRAGPKGRKAVNRKGSADESIKITDQGPRGVQSRLGITCFCPLGVVIDPCPKTTSQKLKAYFLQGATTILLQNNNIDRQEIVSSFVDVLSIILCEETDSTHTLRARPPGLCPTFELFLAAGRLFL